jgi:tetratricopeptide (TPR) repeat protein
MDLSTATEADLPRLKQLATGYWKARNFAEAARFLRKALQFEPDNAHIWNSLAMSLDALGQNVEAVDGFKQAAHHGPEIAAFHENYGRASEQTQSWATADAEYRRALALNPNSEQSLSGLARVSSVLNNYTEQLSALNQLARLRKLTSEEFFFRAEALVHLNRIDEAVGQINKLLRSEPNHAGAHLFLSHIYQQQGEHQEAVKELYQAIEISPMFAPPYWDLTKCKKFSEEDRPMIGQMERQLLVPSRPPSQIGILHFALGNAYHDLKDFKRAIEEYDKANAVYKTLQVHPFDARGLEGYTSNLIAIFSKDFIRSHQDLANLSSRPIFVVGMPRSGTTLTESIISSHPLVAAGGEIPFWSVEAPAAINYQSRSINRDIALGLVDRYLFRLEQFGSKFTRVTDKLPFNFYHLGLLHILFPNAKFIHCRRIPVDNCLSFYMTPFMHPHPFGYDKGNIVFAYRQYARLMAHWKEVLPDSTLFESRYEETVSDQEQQSRRLLEFCGLAWDDACLRPERNERMISTVSHLQARQPVYSRAMAGL